MDDWQIGVVTEQEFETVVDLWQATGLTRPWNDPFSDLRRALQLPVSTVLAGRLRGAVVATVMAGVDGHRGWLYYLAVAPRLQRRGYGGLMLRAGEDWVAQHGAPKVQLMVRAGNEQVQDFYVAQGYRRSDVVVLERRFVAPPE